MTPFAKVMRQSAVFTLKVFFAPIYGSYLAIREAMQERAHNILVESILAAYPVDAASSSDDLDLVVLRPIPSHQTLAQTERFENQQTFSEHVLTQLPRTKPSAGVLFYPRRRATQPAMPSIETGVA